MSAVPVLPPRRAVPPSPVPLTQNSESEDEPPAKPKSLAERIAALQLGGQIDQVARSPRPQSRPPLRAQESTQNGTDLSSRTPEFIAAIR